MWLRLLPTKRCSFKLLLWAAALFGSAAWGRPGGETAAALREASFDPARCYRVRDLSLIREDLKLFLTDGYLLLSRPLGGGAVAAIFSAEVEGGDAEVLLVPPDAAERQSLARFTESPTLNEHFKNALLLFTDGTAAELESYLAERQPRAAPEMGALLASQYSGALRNLAGSFETRLIEDLAGGARPGLGLFFATLSGTRLGNFDVVYDPQAREQVMAGQLTRRGDQAFYEIWTSFRSRRVRRGEAPPAELDFAVRHIAITAALDDALHLKATTRLTIEMPPEAGRRHSGVVLPLDLSRRMRVGGARVDGRAVEVIERESLRRTLLRDSDNAVFLLSLEAPLGAGRHEIEIDHEGDVVARSPEGVYFVAARGTWYPRHGTQFSTYELSFAHGRALTVVASGERRGVEAAGEGRAVTRYGTSVPLRYVGFNLGEYRKTTAAAGGLTVEVYANPAIEAAAAAGRRTEVAAAPPPSVRGAGRGRAGMPVMTAPAAPPRIALDRVADEVGEAFGFFAGKFGPPPLATLQVSPIPGAFGQGFPGLIYLSTLTYLAPEDRPAAADEPYHRTFFSDILVPHEVAHQWWGNAVANGGPGEDWLMEALANYSALMLVEKRRGARAVDEILSFYREHLLARTGDGGRTIESAGPIRLGTRLDTAAAPNAWRTITYEKGSWILHMLRKRMGDAAWEGLLGEVARECRGRPLGVAEFVERAGRRLPAGVAAAWAETWIAGTGIPSLRLTVESRAGERRVAATLFQRDVGEEFSAEVPVEITYAGGKSEVRWVRTEGPETAIRWTAAAPVVKVALDPGGAVLAGRTR